MPSTSLPPLPRVARYRSSLVRVGRPGRSWSYLAIPPLGAARLAGFADVQAIAHDVVALGAKHTAIVQCNSDRSLVGVLVDPPHEVSLRLSAAPWPVLPASTVLVVEVANELEPVSRDDLDGVQSLGTILRRQGIDLLDVARTDGDVVVSLLIAGGGTDPWRMIEVGQS